MRPTIKKGYDPTFQFLFPVLAAIFIFLLFTQFVEFVKRQSQDDYPPRSTVLTVSSVRDVAGKFEVEVIWEDESLKRRMAKIQTGSKVSPGDKAIFLRDKNLLRIRTE